MGGVSQAYRELLMNEHVGVPCFKALKVHCATIRFIACHIVRDESNKILSHESD